MLHEASKPFSGHLQMNEIILRSFFNMFLKPFLWLYVAISSFFAKNIKLTEVNVKIRSNERTAKNTQNESLFYFWDWILKLNANNRKY